MEETLDIEVGTKKEKTGKHYIDCKDDIIKMIVSSALCCFCCCKKDCDEYCVKKKIDKAKASFKCEDFLKKWLEA